jgi:hypothetical protein
MTTPTPDDVDRALEAAIAETGVERYRYLVHEHPDPAVRASYRGWLLAGRPPAAARVHYGDPAPRPCGGCPG